ncbi:MAG: polymorphic toxin-type HINT domain-containing protein [Prosthecobacter sp.]|nr:polymorphic toxin-type HINT domain-containing protein [Prosthecobacter sp.]
MKPNLFRELTTALLCGLILLQSATAAAPGWWSTQGLVIPQRPADDHAVLNQGQLKNFVRAAVYELHAKLPGGAGTLLNNLLHTWRTQKLHADDYAAVTLGQLKAVAQPVYASMQAAGLPLPVPWTSLTTDDDDHAVANLGQAKAVFAFVVPDLVTLGMLDSDGDGFSDALELALGTYPYLASSHPAGLGDVSVGGGGTGDNGSGGAGGAGGGGGGGLPPYVDPYPEPWPDFEAAATADANKDSDNDGVKDAEDAVWYDPKFKHKRGGFPHYNIIDLGKCEGGFIDMADNGAMVWRENSYDDATASLKVWTPSQPLVQGFTFDPNAFGLEDGVSSGITAINDTGTLFGAAFQEVQESSSTYLEDRFFTLEPNGGGAAWLPKLYPDEEQRQRLDWPLLPWLSPGPQGNLFGVTRYSIYPDENSSQNEAWTAFFKLGAGGITFEDKTLRTYLPDLPEDPPDPDLQPSGTRVSLSEGIYHEKYVGFGSGSGVVRSTRRTEVDLDAVAGIDPWGGTYWYHAAAETEQGYIHGSGWGTHAISTEDTLTHTLVTASGSHDLVVQDLLDEPATYHLFNHVSPAAEPWVSANITRYAPVPEWWMFWEEEAFIYKPASAGGAYEPCAIYAGFEDYQADKPIAGIGLLTAQGQAIVYGDFDLEQEGDEVGLWADGEVQLIDNVISGYDRYIDDPNDWQHRWQFHDVSRDGMIAATAWNGTEQRMLLLIPVTTREILANGQLAPAGGGVQTSMPSPVFCASVAADGTPTGTMSCALGNLRVLADGSVVGDLQVSGSLTSQACDNVKGVKGTITQAQLWVNGADTPQATFTVQAAKQSSGSAARPYPYQGSFSTTIANVPLTEGVNTFKFTAEGPVYHMPGYSTWSVTITVTAPEAGSGGGEPGNPSGSFQLSVQLPAPVLAAGSADTLQVTLNFDDAAHNNETLTETSAASGVFRGTLGDGRPLRLSLVNVAALSISAVDVLDATLLVGEAGSALSYSIGVRETGAASSLFTGGYVGSTTSSTGGSSSSSGGVNGSGTTNTDGSTGGSTGGGGTTGTGGGGSAPTATVSTDPYTALQEIMKSNGGEFHRYALKVGIPSELAEHFSCAFNGRTFEIMDDESFGVVFEDPDQPGHPFTPSFIQGNQEISESEQQHAERMAAMQDVSFEKGFAYGLGYGGADMVTSLGDTVAGTAKFLGRGFLGIGLACHWVYATGTGGDTMAVEEMIIEVGDPNEEVVDQGVAIGKFLAAFANDTAAIIPKIEVAMLTGEVDLMRTALHGSETHRKLLAMTVEVLNATMQDLRGSEGQQGYVCGKIVFEALAILASFTNITKVEMLTRLMSKSRLLGTRALQVAQRTIDLLRDTFGYCFVAGTRVQTREGPMKIEDVRIGTEVWAKNEHTKEEGWKPVSQTFVNHPPAIFRLSYEWRSPPPTTPGTDNVHREFLGVTGAHPFWVCNREEPGFVTVEALQVGDELFMNGGGKAVVTNKTQENASAGTTHTTYNFEVADFHSYFVGEAAVWVHNDCTKTLRDYAAVLERYIQDFGFNEATEKLLAKACGDKSLSEVELVDIGSYVTLRRANNGAYLTKPIPWRPLVHVPADPRLVQEARSYRAAEGLLTPNGMQRNVAVAKVKIDGKTEFLRRHNEPFLNGTGSMHSEELLAQQIKDLRREGHIVKVEELFTERIPCTETGCCRSVIRSEMVGARVYYWTSGQATKSKAADLIIIYGL